MTVSLYDGVYDIKIEAHASWRTAKDIVNFRTYTYYHFNLNTGEIGRHWRNYECLDIVETPKALVTLFKLKGIL